MSRDDQSRRDSFQSTGFYFSSMYQVFPWGGRVRQRLGLWSLLLSHGFASQFKISANSSRDISCSIVGRQRPIVARSFTALLVTAIPNPIDLYSFWGGAVLWAFEQLRRLSAVCVLLVFVSNIVRRIMPYEFLCCLTTWVRVKLGLTSFDSLNCMDADFLQASC